MKPVMFQGVTSVYVIPGAEEDSKLPVQETVVQDADLGMQKARISVWELTDEERQMIADGGYVALQIIGEDQPPIAMWIAPEVTEPPPDEIPTTVPEADAPGQKVAAILVELRRRASTGTLPGVVVTSSATPGEATFEEREEGKPPHALIHTDDWQRITEEVGEPPEGVEPTIWGAPVTFEEATL